MNIKWIFLLVLIFGGSFTYFLFFYPLVSTHKLDRNIQEMASVRSSTCGEQLVKAAAFLLDQPGLNSFERTCGFDVPKLLFAQGGRQVSDNTVLLLSDFSYHLARLASNNRNKCAYNSLYCYLRLAVSMELYDVYVRIVYNKSGRELEKIISDGY